MRQSFFGGRGKFVSLLLVTAFSSIAPGFAADPAFNSVQNIVNVFAGSTNYNSAAKYIDYDAMSQRSLGAGEWAKLNVKQKHDYAAALRGLMEQRYYPRWHRIFSKSKVEYVSKSNSGSDVLVKTNLVVGKKKDEMTWRLSEHSDKIISLSIGEKDLLDRLTNRLQPKLKKSGFPATLAWMQSHAKEPDEIKTSSADSVLGEAQ
ncbi:MAG TPA: ABC transporter substrate-binding protein [Drouetiella sp.]